MILYFRKVSVSNGLEGKTDSSTTDSMRSTDPSHLKYRKIYLSIYLHLLYMLDDKFKSGTSLDSDI